MIKHPGIYKDSMTDPKCGEDGWCEALDNHLHVEANVDKKGIGVFLTYNFDKPDPFDHPKRHGIYYLEKRQGTPVMLRFCPFCGADLTFNWDKQDKEPRAEVS